MVSFYFCSSAYFDVKRVRNIVLIPLYQILGERRVCLSFVYMYATHYVCAAANVDDVIQVNIPHWQYFNRLFERTELWCIVGYLVKSRRYFVCLKRADMRSCVELVLLLFNLSKLWKHVKICVEGVEDSVLFFCSRRNQEFMYNG